MKKIFLLFIGILCMSMFLCGCGLSNEYEETTLVVNSDGSLKQVIVDASAGAKTDEEDMELFLNEYIDEKIDSFNAEREGSLVSLDSKELSGNTLKLVLSYTDAAAYNDFNHVICMNTQIQSASESQIDLNRTFYSAKGTMVSKQELLSEFPDSYVLVVEEPMMISIDGTVIAISDGVSLDTAGNLRVENTEDSSVSEEFQTTRETPVYIIYRY